MNHWQIGKVRVLQVVERGPPPTSPRFFFKDRSVNFDNEVEQAIATRRCFRACCALAQRARAFAG